VTKKELKLSDNLMQRISNGCEFYILLLALSLEKKCSAVHRPSSESVPLFKFNGGHERLKRQRTTAVEGKIFAMVCRFFANPLTAFCNALASQS